MKDREAEDSGITGCVSLKGVFDVRFFGYRQLFLKNSVMELVLKAARYNFRPPDWAGIYLNILRCYK